MFTLNDCAHIVGSDVISFKKEDDMLLAWKKFIEEVDPDVVIGYNISGFDLPYLLDRARSLKGAANGFPYLGRLRGECDAHLKSSFLTFMYFRYKDHH